MTRWLVGMKQWIWNQMKILFRMRMTIKLPQNIRKMIKSKSWLLKIKITNLRKLSRNIKKTIIIYFYLILIDFCWLTKTIDSNIVWGNLEIWILWLIMHLKVLLILKILIFGITNMIMQIRKKNYNRIYYQTI